MRIYDINNPFDLLELTERFFRQYPDYQAETKYQCGRRRFGRLHYVHEALDRNLRVDVSTPIKLEGYTPVLYGEYFQISLTQTKGERVGTILVLNPVAVTAYWESSLDHQLIELEKLVRISDSCKYCRHPLEIQFWRSQWKIRLYCPRCNRYIWKHPDRDWCENGFPRLVRPSRRRGYEP